jgi:structural maintenance of chromosome 2
MAHMELVDTTVGRGEKTKTIKGIKMKIGFNGHWKESMTELSGGQRSLLALSFLLAMLKYRAAPFYILDEIDSAMDLSHTENVGYIISKFFPQSQFIVISLKGGLFNAANIIFRTNLVDGRSQINRYDNRKDRKRHRNAMIEDREERGNTLDRIASQNN